jgi:ribosomal protein S18 acetylase RimI-like enzyme
MHIRRLLPSDASAFQSLRLTGLREAPSAFSSSYEDECDTPLSAIEQLIANRNLFGAFIDEQLIGIVSAGRESGRKVQHRGYIRSMYVASTHRGTGAGRKLMAQALSFISGLDGVQVVALTVTGDNAPALALYESLGFQAHGRIPRTLIVDGVAYDDIPMSLSL